MQESAALKGGQRTTRDNVKWRETERMTMDWFFRSSHDERIRYMGWTLLLMWMVSITYMTRDFWFPSAYGLPSLMESDRKRREKAREELREREKEEEEEEVEEEDSFSSCYSS